MWGGEDRKRINELMQGIGIHRMERAGTCPIVQKQGNIS